MRRLDFLMLVCLGGACGHIQSDKAEVRVFNALYDYETLDLIVGDRPKFEDLPYGVRSEYMGVSVVGDDDAPGGNGGNTTTTASSTSPESSSTSTSTLAAVVKHGIDEFRDGPYGFTNPAIINSYYGRWWWPADEKPGANPLPGSPLPWS